MQDLLKRGIAVHHSGILPLIKEVRHVSHVTSLVTIEYKLGGSSLFFFIGSRTPVSERLS